MEQKFNKEKLADDYGKTWLGSDIGWAAAKSGFIAGWDACEQKLKQCNVSGQSEQLPQVNDLMEQIEAECEVYHTEDGEKFKGTSWAQLSKIFEKYGYAPPLPF